MGRAITGFKKALEDLAFSSRIVKRKVCLRDGRFKVFAYHPKIWSMPDMPPLSWMLDSIKSGDVVIDIGANRGYYSLGILSNIPGIQIFAFEPNPGIFEKLKSNIQLNAPLGHIKALPYAIGEKEENIPLYISASDSASSINAKHAEAFGFNIISTVNVKMTTIDSLLTHGEILIPRHIKIDTEGFEGPILRGALKALQEFRPHLYIEIHKTVSSGDNENEIRCILDSIGYQIIKEDKFLFCR